MEFSARRPIRPLLPAWVCSPSAITSAVFNSDWIYADLAVTNKVDNTVSILPGLGINGMQNGTLWPANNDRHREGPGRHRHCGFQQRRPSRSGGNQRKPTAPFLSCWAMATELFLRKPLTLPGSGPVGIVAANFTGTNTDLSLLPMNLPTMWISWSGMGTELLILPFLCPRGILPLR